jgi:hypothetical protein
MCLLVGFELGSWKEGKAVLKAVEDIWAMYNKDIQLIIDKIIEAKKGGEQK